MFYQFNGIDYVLDMLFPTNETKIYQMYISEDFTKFVYGGDYSTIYLYEKINGSYEERYSKNIGNMIYTATLSYRSDYLIVTDNNRKLYTFYKCPPECTNCYFPNNCS